MRYGKGVPCSMSLMLYRFMALKWKRRAFFFRSLNFSMQHTFHKLFTGKFIDRNDWNCDFIILSAWALVIRVYEFGRRKKIVKLREIESINQSGKKRKKYVWLANWPIVSEADRWALIAFLEIIIILYIPLMRSIAYWCDLRSISQFSINLFHMKIMKFSVFRWIEFLAKTFESKARVLAVRKRNETNDLARVAVTFIRINISYCASSDSREKNIVNRFVSLSITFLLDFRL